MERETRLEPGSDHDILRRKPPIEPISVGVDFEMI
jgi:hypothetical protein